MQYELSNITNGNDQLELQIPQYYLFYILLVFLNSISINLISD